MEYLVFLLNRFLLCFSSIRLSSPRSRIAVVALAYSLFSPSADATCRTDQTLYVLDPARGGITEYEWLTGTSWIDHGTTTPALTNLRGLAIDEVTCTGYVLEAPVGSGWQITAVDLLTNSPNGTVITSGLSQPRSLVISDEFDTLWVIDSILGLVRVPLPAGPADPALVTAPPFGLVGARDAVIDDTGSTAYVVVGDRLVSVELSSGKIVTVADGLGQPMGVTLDPWAKFAYITDNASAAVIEVGLDTGCSRSFPLPSVSPSPDLRGISMDGLGIGVFAVDATGRIWDVLPRTGVSTEVSAPAPPSGPTEVVYGGLSFVAARGPSVVALPGGDFEVPMFVGNLTGRGVTTIDLDIGFALFLAVDPFSSSIVAGDLVNDTPGCTLTPTFLGTRVEATVDCVSGPLEGEGIVAVAKFTALLTIYTAGFAAYAVLNGGAVSTVSYSGSANINDGIEGLITHVGSGSVIDDVTMIVDNLTTGEQQCVVSESPGGYLSNGFTFGDDYRFTPLKDGFYCGAINIVDALTAAQIGVGLFIPTQAEATAGDVTFDGSVGLMDAWRIAEVSVALRDRLPVGDRMGSDWFFLPNAGPPNPPTTRIDVFPQQNQGISGAFEYISFVAPQSNEDFLGGLYGDLNASWTACPDPAPTPLASLAVSSIVGSSQSMTLAFDSFVADPGTSIEVPLMAFGTDGAGGTSLRVQYDDSLLAATGVQLTSLSSGQGLVVNLDTPGQIRVGLFGNPFPLQGGGELLRVEFNVLDSADGDTILDLVEAEVNEGAIGVVLGDGGVCVTGGTAPQVTDLILGKESTDPAAAELSWQSESATAVYEVYVANQKELSDVACIAVTEDTTLVDATSLIPGEALYYVVAGMNCSGTGSLGEGTVGPRPDAPGCQ